MHLIEQKTRLFHAFSINLPTICRKLLMVYMVCGNGIYGTFTISNLV